MRDRPVRFSDSTGLRLCGMAEEPFWPSEKYSSASSTSVRCRWRISVASRSTDAPRTPSVAKYMAWRSRGITWVEIGSTASPMALATWASTRGSTCAKVPTAPEIEGVAPLGPDVLGRGLRDQPELGQGVGGMRLALEPDADPGLGRPDLGHLRPGVARDHRRAFHAASPRAINAALRIAAMLAR